MSYKVQSLVYFICLLIASATYYHAEESRSPKHVDENELATFEINTNPILENNTQDLVQ